ncbi:MAG: hypothetical protein KBS65_01590 [Prevotella sp.]|nr:hypothetical protein [Candidatus Equicola stercoris]
MKRLLAFLITTLTLCACTFNGIEYLEYAHTDTSGWLKKDTIFLPYAKDIKGTYAQSLHLRFVKTYPYQNIQIIVNNKTGGESKKKVVTCHLTNKNGDYTAKGVDYLEYEYNIDTINIANDDSLLISIWHNHKKDSLPGMSEIGIALKRLR